MTSYSRGESPPFLMAELANFQRIARAITPAPGQIPRVPGLDVAGAYLPLSGVVGGDHVIYLDFDERFDLEHLVGEAEALGRDAIAANLSGCRDRVGVLVADVAGHNMTDALVGAMLHQAFLVGVYYELERYGRVTTKLFELINQQFHRTTGVSKYVTMVYAEVSSAGAARVISAGHPLPRVYRSAERRLEEVDRDLVLKFPPIGMFSSYVDTRDSGTQTLRYERHHTTVAETPVLAPGDALLLYSDGLSEHAAERYFPAAVEAVFTGEAEGSAARWCDALSRDLLAASEPRDDVSFVVVRRVPDSDRPVSLG